MNDDRDEYITHLLYAEARYRKMFGERLNIMNRNCDKKKLADRALRAVARGAELNKYDWQDIYE